MLREQTLPLSLVTPLSCFTAPTFTRFCALVVGMLAQPGRRTVTGMLVGSGLSRVWPHDRAHTFFSAARWCADELGETVARLVVALLVPAEATVTVIVDDTLLPGRGPKAWPAGWFHDGSAKTPEKVG